MKAFLVIGVEGSGTYMLWEALASAGCGIDIDEKPMNYTERWSLPHAGEWPNFPRVMDELEAVGYEIQPLVIFRDYYCTIKSVLRRDTKREWGLVELNMATALKTIGLISSIYKNIVYITYEAFCQSEGFRRWLFKSKLCLPEPTIEINFANEKWYE